MNRKIFCLALLVAAVVTIGAARGESSPRVALRARVDRLASPFMNFLHMKLQNQLGNRLNISEEALTTPQEDVEKLSNGDVDFLITSQPVTSADVVHFPMATGGISLLVNIRPSHTYSLRPEHVAKIFSGEIRQWGYEAIVRDNPELRASTLQVKPIIWQKDSATAKEVKRFLEYNSGAGVWSSTQAFAPYLELNSYQEAVTYVLNTPGAITYAPFGERDPTGTLIPVQIILAQLSLTVSPTANAFMYSLMTIKTDQDMPRAQDQSGWQAFSLTDMRKMPNDGSCMAKPPYPISRFFYLVAKRDQSQREAFHGAGIGAVVRIASSPAVQDLVPNSNVLTSVPVLTRNSNIDQAASVIIYRAGESRDSFMPNVPVAVNAPDPAMAMPEMDSSNMVGDASTASVTAMIIFLLSSGLIVVGAYAVFLRIKYNTPLAEFASWPWNQRSTSASNSSQSSPPNGKYVPLDSSNISSSMDD